MLNRDRLRALRASGLQARAPAPDQQKRIRVLGVKARAPQTAAMPHAQSKFAQGERTLLAETPWAEPFQVLRGRVFGPRRYSGDTPVLCAFCVGVRLLRHHFDTGHGCVSLHGNKAQQ